MAVYVYSLRLETEYWHPQNFNYNWCQNYKGFEFQTRNSILHVISKGLFEGTIRNGCIYDISDKSKYLAPQKTSKVSNSRQGIWYYMSFPKDFLRNYRK